ncbi:MAG: hypothetical protein MRJ96_08305 [Nitrospirales bacterium]|nr:hypothetical protein [Nitrospira sp.]MDR4501434.1 hypothetical protein [Nitrospirales bacterium]
MMKLSRLTIVATLTLCVWFGPTVQAHATLSNPLITIELDKPVYFIAPDGSPLVTDSATFSVEAAQEWIRLIPDEPQNALLIEAKKGTHELELSEALALSVPDTEDGQHDRHHILLLLPDGKSLEATGTYSGIRQRGMFDHAVNNVKKQANRAYQKARSTAETAVSKGKSTAQKTTKQIKQQTQKAVSQAKKSVENTRNAALQAKRQVEQAGRQVAGAVRSGVQDGVNQLQDNPMLAKLQSEIQTLQAVRQLKLEPLFGCLAQASGSATGNVGQMAQQLVNNPAGFANKLFQDLMQQWEQNFSEIMGEQLQFIKNPSRSAPQGEQVVSMAFRSLEKLAQKGPAGRCLMQFASPHLKTVNKMSGQVQQTAKTQAKRIFDNQVAPVLYGGISKQIGKILSAATSLTPRDIAQTTVRSRGIAQEYGPSDSPDSPGQIVSRGFGGDDAKALLGEVIPGLGDIIDIKNAVLADQLLNPQTLHAAASHVERLSRSLDNTAQRAQALSGVRTALDPNSPWTETLYIDIGMEILRVVGKNYLNSELPGGGSFLIRSAVEVLDFGEQTVGTVVQSAAGLVPEVGGIISGVAKVTPDVIWKLTINNIIVGSVKGGLLYAYGKVIDEGKKALKSGRPYATIQQHAGPLTAILRYLPSKQQIIILASTHTEDTRKALERYNRSVLLLAEAAAR